MYARRRSFTLVALALVGCDRPAESPVDSTQELLCPELGGNVDPMAISYSDKPSADAQIRAFVAAARGLNDASVQAEKLAVEACRRMSRDLGAPESPPNAPIDVQCRPLRALLEKLAREGVQVRVAIAPPRCEPDAARRSRCEALAGGEAGAPQTLCLAQAAVYARCSLPAVSFAGSTNAEEVVKLGRTLEENLPTLLYGEMALARRIAKDAEEMVGTSARLSAEIKDAGPRGLACVGLATTATIRSAERLRSFIAATGALVAGLDPEIQPTGGAR